MSCGYHDLDWSSVEGSPHTDTSKSDASAETAVSRAGQTATSSHCRLPQGHTAQVSYAVKPWLDAATMRILAFQ